MSRTLTYLAIISVFITLPIFGEIKIPDKVEDIKISLETQSDINNALHVIKEDNQKDYEELLKLKKENSKDFLPKLKNRYYTWMNRQVLLKKRKPRPVGYRKKVKMSEIRLNELKKEYQSKQSKAEKDKLLKTINEEASKRFDIEKEQMEHHLKEAEKYLTQRQKKLAQFNANKERFIKRITNKLTGPNIEPQKKKPASKTPKAQSNTTPA